MSNDEQIEYWNDDAGQKWAEQQAVLDVMLAPATAALMEAAAILPGERVLDIGCGTGLVAAEMNLPRHQIDGFDISQAMLDVAAEKALYRQLHAIDLTAPITLSVRYGALVSAGTFTHGHLGPEPLANILTLAKPGALFVIGVNAQHFEAHDFGGVLDRLAAERRIRDISLETVGIYDRPDTPHGKDEAQILTFRAP